MSTDQSIYGAWEGKIHDFRKGRNGQDGVAPPELAGLTDFAPHNPTKAFIADRGFMVFDRNTNLTEVFRQYMEQAARESCGRCSPCRVGTQRMRDLLKQVCDGDTNPALLDEIEVLAQQVTSTSLCGMGKSCARSLVIALKHFRDEFKPLSPAQAMFQHSFIYTTAPCIEACPSKIDVPRYVDGVKSGKFDYALGVVLEKYPMAATCGRVCVRYCEEACRRKEAEGAVGIRMLKRYAADQAIVNDRLHFKPAEQQYDKRVAVVGAGPAGITCAYQLLVSGIQVDVFDANQAAGGMASVGIPSYRLPKDVLRIEGEDIVRQLGGKFHFGKVLGQNFSVDELFENGYDAVFLSYGASEGTQLGLPNESPDLRGYISGVDFLRKVYDRVEQGKSYEIAGSTVVVVGGGNVAMDCVRSALRLGAKSVRLVYRRTEEDMPAEHEEIVAAREEGVEFHFLTTPSGLVIEDKVLKGLELVKMRTCGHDEKGRSKIEEVPDSTYTMSCDLVIAAIGQKVQNVVKPSEGIALNRSNYVVVDPDTLQTTREGVFAGGDCVLGPLTLVNAMDHGERAAYSIRDYVLNGQVQVGPERRMQNLLARNRLTENECLKTMPAHKERAPMPELDPEERAQSFDEVDQVLSKNAAYQEATRCLRCYRLYSIVTEKQLPRTTPTNPQQLLVVE